MSSRMSGIIFTGRILSPVLLFLAGWTVFAQYPGQLKKESKSAPDLRAVGVLEWTGDPGKPKTSRLVPITVFNGENLQDGGVYLARPQPMALEMGVEYVLEENGKPIGLYDIRNAGQEQGSWVGFGSWKPMPSAKPKPVKPIDTGFDPDDDKPVLHRKSHSDSSSGSDTKSSEPAPDPDRPTLHKDAGESDSAGSEPAPDPDRPTLHKPDSDKKEAGNPSGPVLHKGTQSATDTNDGEHSNISDPDRPRLVRGKSGNSGADVLPSLMGLPADMEQTVAVSDAKSHPEHGWNFSWANPADEDKMKEQMEDIARNALGLTTPPPPAPKRASAKSRLKTAPRPEPPALAGETFRVFELAYGSGATMVLSAHNDGPPAEQKFVTLIAQPDLYGNLLVLLKHVTDAAHLDENPRMRLVDAVDALADNRGELLFELRGKTQRQFALYRVLRGTAEKIFVTGGGEYGGSSGI